jgi:hypothetical protein
MQHRVIWAKWHPWPSWSILRREWTIPASQKCLRPDLGVGAGKKEIVELREVAARECHFMETRTRTVRLGFGEGKIKDAANAMLTDTKPIMKLKAVGTQAPGLIHLWIWMGRRPSGMHGVAPYVHAQQGEGSTIAKDAPSCVRSDQIGFFYCALSVWCSACGWYHSVAGWLQRHEIIWKPLVVAPIPWILIFW